ncbi:site-specific integrase, partial [Acidobacteria bacterium AH-259-O06]|nr:site-specific integrase [Acidobacteria bacterium AH-259-O06]
MTAIASHITAFLRQRLEVERAASPHTRDTYAYAFQLLFNFASQKLGVPPSALQLEQIDAPLVLKFLEDLETRRRNGARTRNARLTAIKSFMHFVEHRVPSALEQIKRVLTIPAKKTSIRLVNHLTAEQCRAILDAPDPTTRLGIRDRTMLHLALTSGLRVSELVGICLDDVSFQSRYLGLHVRGKGRKDRILTLWKVVSDSVRAWLAVRGEARVPELFLNARGREMTRAGFEYLLRKYAATARDSCPSLRGKRVSPHVLRHTCALNILQATGDIRKVALWLGHESIQTTEDYLRVDVTQKIGILKSVSPPQLRPGKFRPPDKL